MQKPLNMFTAVVVQGIPFPDAEQSQPTKNNEYLTRKWELFWTNNIEHVKKTFPTPTTFNW